MYKKAKKKTKRTVVKVRTKLSRKVQAFRAKERVNKVLQIAK